MTGWFQKCSHIFLAAHAVVLSDYAKGVLTPGVCQLVIQAARKLGIPVLVDPKSTDFTRYHGATTICPNLGELATAAHVDAGDLSMVLDAAEAMVTALDVEFLTATLGDKGIALVRPGNRFIAPAVARQVFDVSGAGDTVISVLALCLASGLKPETAIELANIAASIVVGKVGTVPVEKHELLAALAPEIALHAEDKVVGRKELVIRVAAWKAIGERVVFTNGCFDLLHIGHITVLEQARSFGDRLIVAINSDASVSGLKGPQPPHRAASTNEPACLPRWPPLMPSWYSTSPPRLSSSWPRAPTCIVKGGDYGVDTVVGARRSPVLGRTGQDRSSSSKASPPPA